MRHNLIYLLLFSVLFNCQTKINKMPKKITLHENWEFKKSTDSVWSKATVPGNVHSDLLENNLIEHPFIKNNEDSLQWISETNWIYKTEFSLQESTLNHNYLEFNFEGLDTYAKVILNDSLILESNNAFRQWQVNVKSLLKTDNELRIEFTKPSEFENIEKSKLSYELPEGNRVFTRKGQFQYGWDWGIKLNTFGIWKPITLTYWDETRVNDVFIKQDSLTDSNANLTANLEFKNPLKADFMIDVYVNDTLNRSFEMHHNPEIIHYNIPIEIKNPKRWWPHNLGDPYLYDIKFVIRQNEVTLDNYTVKTGLRTVKLITEKDAIGETFYFEVNGVPVYMKGANYIPQHSMQNYVTYDTYNRILNDVADANMNMIRVWGGGIYETDTFYNLCDEKGIMVWQDFMFACAMYPGDKAFLDNITQEAIDNVKRLRNHPSIALWCGNNENAEGWDRWGWQQGKTQWQKEEIWANYLKVFDEILPKVVTEFADNISYWESSPRYGRGNPLHKTEGDAHDWFIWHDAYPFEHLEENVPRFMSEFGFQSFPSYEAIKFSTQNDSLGIFSDDFKTHQKHARGFDLIKTYMERDFPIPTADEDYVYMSQVLQAHGITKGLEAQRRAKPYNMGTLYWQLNDCWPVISWSSIDFFGNWKALHYKAKRSFENVLLSSKIDNDTLKTYIVNDEWMQKKGMLSIHLKDFKGNTLWSTTKDILVDKNSSAIYHKLDLNSLKINRKDIVVITQFDGETSYFYLVKPKELALENSTITTNITDTKDGFTIELKSTTLQKDVFLFTDAKGHFSDNFFDLMPNQSLKIEFKTNASTIDDLKIKTLNMFVRENFKA